LHEGTNLKDNVAASELSGFGESIKRISSTEGDEIPIMAETSTLEALSIILDFTWESEKSLFL
jgi:hypothetical protein